MLAWRKTPCTSLDGSILLKVGAQGAPHTPVNGLCSFIGVQELPDSYPIGELVAQALKGQRLLGE